MRLFPILLSLGCGPPLEEDVFDGYRRLTGSVSVGGSGQRALKLEPEPGEVAMLVTAVPVDGFRSHVVEVAQDKVLVFDAVEEATGVFASTNAGFLSTASTLNWPRSGAEALGAMEVTLGNVSADDTYVNGALDVTVLFKTDADLSLGTVSVAIVYAGGVDEDPELMAAMGDAIGRWRVLYSSVGLTLDIVDGLTWPEGDLEAPVYGTDDNYAEISAAFGPHVVPVVVAPQIVDLESVLGVAGDIPGAMVSSRRSGVLVSALASAGIDGEFEDLEVRLLAETLAHEVGHYLGLFHPVESEDWARWDALDDTEQCKTESRCEDALRGQLMFPYPVCSFAGCTAQEVITAEQEAVMHRYTGVR